MIHSSKLVFKNKKNKYQRIFTLVLAWIVATSTYAQISIGTTTPEPSAMLELSSTSQGFLPPRMTYAQRNNMALPVPSGLMIWCTDCGDLGELQVFNGTSWSNLIGEVATSSKRLVLNQPLILTGVITGEAAADYSGHSVAMSADGHRVAIGAPYNDGNQNESGHVRVYEWRDGSGWVQIGSDIDGKTVIRLPIDGQIIGSTSGYSVAMSADGNRVAVGGPANDGNGNYSGHVQIFGLNGSTWEQIGSDIYGEAASDQSGTSVALSADGNRVIIGAPWNDDNGNESGHSRVYDLIGSTWEQIGTDIDGKAASDKSGTSVAISADGTHVAIGASENHINIKDKGYVRVYKWNGSSWVQIGADIAGEALGDENGKSVDLSSDGTILAMGAPGNDGKGTNSGHTRIYKWNGSLWVQMGSDIDGEATGEQSGTSVSLSADGHRIAVGSPRNGSNGTLSGQVRIYDWDGSSWVQTRPDINGNAGDQNGFSVALSADGTHVATGAPRNSDNGPDAGLVRIIQ